jgi:hypothetical protein
MDQRDEKPFVWGSLAIRILTICAVSTCPDPTLFGVDSGALGRKYLLLPLACPVSVKSVSDFF